MLFLFGFLQKIYKFLVILYAILYAIKLYARNSIFKIDIDRIKENHEEFLLKNKSVLKAQHRFKSERHSYY